MNKKRCFPQAPFPAHIGQSVYKDMINHFRSKRNMRKKGKIMNDTFFNQFQNIQKYDYQEAVASDIRERINDMTSDDLDKAEQYDGNPVGFLSDMVRDYVTGNSDGSYWCNTWKAECCLFRNRELLEDYQEWEGLPGIMEDAPETQDVKIREKLFDGAAESVFYDLNNMPVYELTNQELYLLIVLSDLREAEQIAEAAKRANMSEAWKNADPDTDLDDVINDILKALRESA